MIVTTLPTLSPCATEFFLRDFFPAAVARSRERLDPVVQARLEAFARGELSASERQVLIPLLASHPLAVDYLARLLKEGPTPADEEE